MSGFLGRAGFTLGTLSVSHGLGPDILLGKKKVGVAYMKPVDSIGRLTMTLSHSALRALDAECGTIDIEASRASGRMLKTGEAYLMIPKVQG